MLHILEIAGATIGALAIVAVIVVAVMVFLAFMSWTRDGSH